MNPQVRAGRLELATSNPNLGCVCPTWVGGFRCRSPRLSQALGFNGVTDTIAVTTKLKGVIDHSKVGKYELDKSLKSIFCRQWEEVARSNDPVKM